MSIIVITSLAGGTGKTTIAAAAALALKLAGSRVLVASLTEADDLALQLGTEPGDVTGFTTSLAAGHDWRRAIRTTPSGVSVLPSGLLFAGKPAEAMAATLCEGLREFASGQTVLVDAPDWAHPVTTITRAVADLSLVVLRADVSNFAQVMRRGVLADPAVAYAVNAYDDRVQLQSGILGLIERCTVGRLLGLVRHDAKVPEAFASGETILAHDREAGVTRDLVALALAFEAAADTRHQARGATL